MDTMPELPSGTVTFLFTDIEGSTKLLHELGSEGYSEALAEHRRILREAFGARGGVEVDTQGDAFFVAFPTAPGALEAAAEALKGLGLGPIQVRIGIHTGTPLVSEEGYVGPDVHRAARIATAGHGGQVLFSQSTRALLETNDGLSLVDLGEHRLKDLSAPERIYQLGSGEFPPLKTLYRTNLPIPATPFLGRGHELAQLQELLAREDVRLLTLAGPGGTGKTRLALQAAAQAADGYPDGVFWVPLAPLREPALVLEQAGQAVGATDGLADHLADKHLLLLLDNFEHLIEAAAELAGLLASCPNLRLLVTSRELLRIEGEQAYPVPPLAPPEGVELFTVRARAADPAFAPTPAVEELCAKLDHLPLALELAAARVRVLSPEQLLERLATRLDLLKGGRDADPRQQTLRATIEWSHDLLEEEEQRLFARLAVFRGGCTLEAAEQVADADLDTLQSLVDKSLLRHSGERFWMLETIREFARERLSQSGDEPELRRRHARFFLRLVEEADRQEEEGNVPQSHALALIAAEHGNVRAALEWARDLKENEVLLRLTAPLSDFWTTRGFYRELQTWAPLALERASSPRRARARLFTSVAFDALMRGDFGRAEGLIAEWRLEAEKTGDQSDLLAPMNTTAILAAEQGDLDRARAEWLRVMAVAGEIGDRSREASTAVNLAAIACRSGDPRAGFEYATEAAQLFRNLGEESGTASALLNRGWCALDIENVAAAEVSFREALVIAGRLGAVPRIAMGASGLGVTLVLGGQEKCGAQLLGAAGALYETLESGPADAVEEKLQGRAVVAAKAALGEEAFAAAWARGQAMTPEEIVQLNGIPIE
jgi:predicted ATPase/class 3 adenylate cyclase